MGEFAQFAVAVQDGASVRAAYVIHGQIAALLTVNVAVHAGVVGAFVVTDYGLVKVLDAAFHDGDLVVHLI